jgi:hypothetical protein
MKYIMIFFFWGLGLMACENNNDSKVMCEEKLPCSGDCLFTIENMEAQTSFISCFDRWGFIFTDPANPEFKSAAIPDKWDKKFEIDSMDIVVCGILRENEIPLKFPDPSFGRVYQIDVKEVEKK